MTDYTIVGGGLAGLLMAQALLDSGHSSLTLIHKTDSLEASSAPLAICHPFPGRSLKPHPLLESAYKTTRAVIEQWRGFAPDLIHELPMTRPIQGANHDRLVRSYQQHWENNPAPWLQVRIEHDPDQLVYGPCFAVALGELCLRWIAQLTTAGLTIRTGTCEAITKGGQHILVDGELLHTKQVILCNGRNLGRYLPNNPLINEGGELGSFHVQHPLPQLVSQAGLHVGPLEVNTVVVGSTRWDTCPEEPPSAALPELQNKMEIILGQTLTPLSAWRGVRAIYPTDRLPIAGKIPGYESAYALGALGSKGLLWGPLAAKALAEQLTNNTAIDEALSLNRLY
jgi:glycine/D-amino acid oxidase-like deaminating enzyme